jgi:hypothetical protein
MAGKDWPAKATGTANGTHAPELSSEKVLEAKLAASEETMRRLTAVLAAVLIEHHRGRALLDSESVDAAYGDPTRPNGFMVDVATLKPLGRHRLQVVTPDGATYVPPAVVIEAENKPSAPCADDWHRHGSGLRCPTCGSSERIS